MPPAGFPPGAGGWPGAAPAGRCRNWRRDQHTLLSLGMLLAQQVAAMDRKPPLTLALVAGKGAYCASSAAAAAATMPWRPGRTCA